MKSIEAEASAGAVRAAAEASRVRYEVDAARAKAINEAANLLLAEQVATQIRIKLIENLDRIIAESVKPMENIDSIRIVQMDGINSAGGASGAESGSSGGNLADQVVSGALRYRAQAPLMDQLMAEVGLSGGALNGLTAALRTAPPVTPEPDAEAAPAKRRRKKVEPFVADEEDVEETESENDTEI